MTDSCNSFIIEEEIVKTTQTDDENKNFDFEKLTSGTICTTQVINIRT